MGRIRYSGSPVARARANTTTEMMASATSDWTTRATTNRSKRPRAGLLPGRELIEEEVVHHAAHVPLAEALGGRVGGVQVHERHPRVLVAQPGEDVPHQRVDLLLVGLAHDLRDHAV